VNVPITADTPNPTRCSRCGTSFGCGAQMAACWCQQLPRLDPARIDAAAGCYCPDCLKALVRQQQDKDSCGSSATS